MYVRKKPNRSGSTSIVIRLLILFTKAINTKIQGKR